MLAPSNYPLWEVFDHLTSQPQIAGMGGLIGFDLSNIEFLLRTFGFPESDDLVNIIKLRRLSAVATKVINANAEKSKATKSNRK